MLDDYTPFEFKQLVHQNADNYPNHSTSQGFGKVTSISDDTVAESLDVMNIQTYYCQVRNNLIFKRVKLPEYYESTLKFYVDGALTTPDAIFTDTIRKESWVFWKSTGITESEFTATYFEPEIYNTSTLSEIDAYTVEENFPIFNDTFVYTKESTGNKTAIHRSTSLEFGRKRQDCMKVRVYDSETVTYEEVNYSTSEFDLTNVNDGNHITFEVFANGLKYPETEKYLWSNNELSFTGNEYYNPDGDNQPVESAPEDEEQVPEDNPVSLIPEIQAIRREGSEVVLLTNNDVTVKIYRKLKERDDWELVGETTEDTFTDEIDSAKNYIYAIRLSNSETESALSESVYVAGRKNTSTVSQVGF